jgi:CPA2 family monovalent cation:H+ antiporter-2
MDIPILKDIILILGISVAIILLFQRFRIPSLLGFLAAGVLVGPHGFDLMSSAHEVELLSEIGIIFLLFVIGIEFSLKGLTKIRSTVLIGGSIQVLGTIAITALVAWLFNLPLSTSVFLGFLFSLSSTAIVLKSLQDKAEVSAPHGRIAVGILIFQDIMVVPMMLLTPILAGKADNIGLTLAILIVKVIVVIAAIYLLARFVVPKVFEQVVKTRNKELFLLTVTVFCFSVAWLTSTVGLSLALGAFFAGLIISESDYSHQATANVLPFREIFISFFFVSVGSLLDIRFFIAHIHWVILLTLAVIGMKMMVIAVAAFSLKYPPRTIIVACLSIFQVGEFSLLLSGAGLKDGLLTEEVYQLFLSIAILSMGLTPFVMDKSTQITDFIVKTPIPRSVKRRLRAMKAAKAESALQEKELKDHLVIIGYGVNGENIARAARFSGITYCIVDIDPEALAKGQQRKEPIIYGDATEDSILRHLHVHEARVVVIAISDPASTRKMVSTIRLHTRTACIIVRTRYIKEMVEVLRLGADEVIPEEFETSIQIFTRVMKKYLVPGDEIENFVAQLRSSDYTLLTEKNAIKRKTGAMVAKVPNREIVVVQISAGNDKLDGKTLRESGLREEYGVIILAIQRGEQYITELKWETVLRQNDKLYVFGDPMRIYKMNELL